MDAARQLGIVFLLVSFVIALVLSIALNFHYHSAASDINQNLEAQVGQVRANTGYFNISMTRAYVDALIQDAKDLHAGLQEAQKQNEHLTRNNATLEATAENLRQNVEGLRVLNNQLETDNQRLTSETQQLKVSWNDQQQRLAKSEQTNRQLLSQTSQLTAVKNQLEQTNRQLLSQTSQLTAVKNQLGQTNRQLLSQNSQLTQQNIQLRTSISQIQTEFTRIEQTAQSSAGSSNGFYSFLASVAPTLLNILYSDVNLKENFQPVDGEDTLAKVRELTLESWNYKGQDHNQLRHYGPTAQEFFAAFGDDGVGTIGTETTINIGDMTGIMMVAIQALEQRTNNLELLRARVAEL